jgi:hypothetical protein
MIYNLSPIYNLSVPNVSIWNERLLQFFSNEDYDATLQDWYYDKIIDNINEVQELLNAGYFVDPYTGLFSIPSPHIEATHSFNLAHFISKHPQHFFGKRILTVCADFGMLNIQAKLSGLNIVSSIQKEYYNVGTVLACIGNNSPPYPINVFDFPDEDVVFMSCVFQDDDLAYKNWEFMMEKRIEGKEVFFTSNSYFYLRRYMNYDKIELVIDPRTVYNEEDYSDISYGYMNRIYRLK